MLSRVKKAQGTVISTKNSKLNAMNRFRYLQFILLTKEMHSSKINSEYTVLKVSQVSVYSIARKMIFRCETPSMSMRRSMYGSSM
jgi:hypothetical protein